MKKEKQKILDFRTSLCWSVCIPKNDNTLKAFIEGATIADSKEITPAQVEKVDIKKLIDQIKYSWNTAIPKNKMTIVAFFEGYDTALSPNFDTMKSSDENYIEICNLFEAFIYNKFKIRHIHWYAQIDTYAYRTHKDWMTAFMLLLEEFYTDFTVDDYKKASSFRGISLIKETNNSFDDYNFTDFTIESNPEKSIIINGEKIEKGTIIQLGDLVKEDYKKAFHYDLSVKDPSWSLYEASENDFKFVKLCYLSEEENGTYTGNTFKRARRIFSGIKTVVKNICVKEGKTYVYTDFFEIEIYEAIKNGEVIIVSEYNEKDKKLCEILRENIQTETEHIKLGFVSSEKMMEDFYWNFFGYRSFPKWINYSWTFGGWNESKTGLSTNYLEKNSD